MKKMWYYTLMLFALCFTACEDTDKLEADINSLNDRVEALENKVEMLNGNIKALNILCQDGMIISKVEHDAENGVYTLSLSDGTTLKLAERVDGFASVPLVTINENGNWAVSYDDGASFVEIKKGDAPVYAIGKDGITPEFRVGTEDFWEISLDGGNNYVRVLDENGNPVKAVYDPATNPNQQFTGVVQKTDYLEITLSSDNTVKVPIVPGFFCYFDRAITGEQNINPGGTKTFNVHINGAESTVITAPMGWKATLAEADAITHVAVLTVIAPKGKPATRAIADNTRDISILAMKGGLATLTKIQVNPIEVETGGGDEPTPPAELFIPTLSESTTILDFVNKDPQIEPSTDDFWFVRRSTGTDMGVSVVDDVYQGNAIKSLKIISGSDFGWFKMAAGFFKKTTNCNISNKYKLSLKVKGTTGKKLQFVIRNAGGTASFLLCDKDGNPLSPKVVTTYQVSTDDWEEASAIFDFSKKRDGSAANSEGGTINPTTVDDIQSLEIRIYSATANTTFFVTDLKFEEYVPVAQ